MSKRQKMLPGQPCRIQRKRTSGWKMPANTVYVGRPSPFGNPIASGYMGDGVRITKREVVQLFREYVEQCDGPNDPLNPINIKRELRGKNLACWCKQGEPCHADVLLEIANQ